MSTILPDSTTSPLSATNWTGQWIGVARPDTGKTGPLYPCPLLRGAFKVEKPVKRAWLTWTALGLAEIELNGCRLSNDFLVPGWTDFRYRTQSLEVDCTEFLREGENVLGAILGDGWYCGTLLWKNERNHYGTAPQLLAQLEIEFADGSTQVVATGKDWVTRSGPILESDLYHGESYDARAEVANWSSPGPVDGSWKPVDSFEPYVGIIEPKRCAPVRVIEELKPKTVVKSPAGGYIFDFGQNFTGICRLKLQGKASQEITLHFAEMLQSDGSLYRENLRLARATDVYRCKGEGNEEWTPRFTFHGFRYVEVSGLEAAPDLSLLTGLVLHNVMKQTGSFECSNIDINQLNSNIRWGQRSNFLEVPTDCPQRDERLGWTGDAQAFVSTAAFHYDVKEFFEKWMVDLCDGQRENGAFPDVAPDLLRDAANSGNAGWADAGVICPWIIYSHYGDTRILKDNYKSMMAWIKCQESTSKALIRPLTAYGDWLAIDAVRADRAPVPSDLIGTAYFAHTTELMEKIAGVLGFQEDAAQMRKLHGEIVSAFQREYVTPNGRVVGECQTAYLVALAFDLLPEGVRAGAVDRLVKLSEAREWHLSPGFLGTPFLCPVLSRFGRIDVAYKLLLQDTYPSWLYPIRNGATTMWERWNSYTHENGFGPVEMNSFNHYAYGAIGAWIYSVVGGIRALEVAYRKVLIAPEPGEGITWAKTSLDTPQGVVSCHWTLADGSLNISFSVPAGVQAQVQLPSGFKASGPLPTEFGPGDHKATASVS